MTDDRAFQRYESSIARIYGPTGTAIGAGFWLADGYVLTCAHVVTEALNLTNTAKPALDAEIGLEFPWVAPGQKLQARVVYWCSVKSSSLEFEEVEPEDIAGLALINPEQLPPEVQDLSPEVLKSYLDTPFRAYGFPKQRPIGCPIQGKLRGRCTNGWIHIEGDTVQGYGVEGGFSGAPVWGETLQGEGCIGMIVAKGPKLKAQADDPKAGYMIPTRALAQALNYLALLSRLEPAYSTIEKNLRAAYRFCQPSGWQEPYPDGNLSRVLELLEQMPDGSQATGKFVAHLVADVCLNTELRQSLSDWASSQIVKFQELVNSARQWMQQDGSSQVRPRETAVLVVLEPSAEKQEHFRIQVWAQCGCPADDDMGATTDRGTFHNLLQNRSELEDAIPLTQIPKILETCLALAGEVAVEPRVEIFLPIQNWDLAAEAWEIEDEDMGICDYLGDRYTKVLRSYERLEKPKYRAAWHKGWIDFVAGLAKLTNSQFVQHDGQNLGVLKAELSQPETIGLLLTQAPSTLRGGPLAYVISQGIPAALWVRQELAHCDSCAELIRIAQCPVRDLPQQVKTERQHAYSRCGPAEPLDQTVIGHHLALLWENPRRLPPTAAVPSLQMP